MATSSLLASTPEDISVIKLVTDFGTLPTNTFLSVAASAFTDVASVGIEEITGVPVTMHTSDTLRSSLVSFAINMQTGQLDLTFNDIVLASPFDASAISVQSGRYADNAERVTLSQLSLTNSTDGYVITVSIHPRRYQCYQTCD